MQQRRVCIDARLRGVEATGVASYARALEAALRAVGETPLVLDDDAPRRFGTIASPVERTRRWLRGGIARPVQLRCSEHRLQAGDVFRLAQVRFDRSGALLSLVVPGAPGIMHWTYPIAARIEGWINVYTIHDVIPLTRPDLSPIDPAKLRRRLAAVARSADRIVTVSDASRHEIIETLGLPPDRVVNCGGAVADVASDADERAAGLVPGDYHLVCGSIEPRKNIERVIAGWRASGSRRRLVFAGPEGPGAEPLIRLTDEEPNVVRLGYLPRPRLLATIAAARAVLMPSLAEGFGLPVVEAMSLGVPVLTSDHGALAEVAGGAALLVDPLDSGAIGRAIRRLEEDEAFRSGLIARGLVRAESFTPEAFGARLARLYDTLVGEARFGP